MPLGWGQHQDFFEDMITHFDKEITKVKGKTYFGKNWNDPITGACKYLHEDGHCTIYNKILSLVCKIFPVQPHHIVDYDKCAYYFEEVTQEQIEILLTQGKIRHVWQNTYEEVPS